jgi:hypothetical protein
LTIASCTKSTSRILGVISYNARKSLARSQPWLHLARKIAFLLVRLVYIAAAQLDWITERESTDSALLQSASNSKGEGKSRQQQRQIHGWGHEYGSYRQKIGKAYCTSEDNANETKEMASEASR